jgi:hypothetical protein
VDIKRGEADGYHWYRCDEDRIVSCTHDDCTVGFELSNIRHGQVDLLGLSVTGIEI